MLWKRADDELVMISALEHYSYCPRQCALIHVEQVFDENLYTLRGRRAHERVDDPKESALEEGVRVERGLPLFSERFGLLGKADVVEFCAGGTPYPVEYKSGPRRQKQHDDLQLCAQALCLEEMFGQQVSKGAIYHHASHRRREVFFDEGLRSSTEKAIWTVRRLLVTATMPPPVADARCPKCSLFDACMPFALAGMGKPAHLYDPEY
ncbi:MAG: CRISPR-associated protein Cas4 [Actinobacteria bacterium]|jgi:CRISPR-associated exonuclease Cas4|nr:MAG: CRISPR-associated protein Cas4 [Actinomycetota bacterium]